MKKSNSTPEQWAKYLAQQKERYAANKEERKARQRAYYARNAAERIAYSKKYAAEHQDKLSAYKRAYDIENRETMNAQKLESQRRRMTDPEKRAHYNQLQQRYYSENRPHKHAWRAKHGFHLELVVKLKAFQGNACAICGTQFDETSRSRTAHNDHDHDTGKTRGLLCFTCNIAEGKIRKTGLTALEFGQRLHDYLLNPPADRFVDLPLST